MMDFAEVDAGGSDNSVRIMSIHKSGFRTPIVFVSSWQEF